MVAIETHFSDSNSAGTINLETTGLPPDYNNKTLHAQQIKQHC